MNFLELRDIVNDGVDFEVTPSSSKSVDDMSPQMHSPFLLLMQVS